MQKKLSHNVKIIGNKMIITIRWLATFLLLSSIYVSGCSQVVREGVREGKLIESESVCKSCLISTENKMEFVNRDIPNKVEVSVESTYGDKIKYKYESVGYREIGHPPVFRTVINKVFRIPLFLGLVLLTPSYYTEPAYNCKGYNSLCSYSTDTWIVEYDYKYSTVVTNTFSKYLKSTDPVTVSIDRKQQYKRESSNNDNTKTRKPAKKVKKAKKEKKASDSNNSYDESNASTTAYNSATPTHVSTQIIYPVNGIVDVDLCKLRDGSTLSGEYQIRYGNRYKNIESTFKLENLAYYCPDITPLKDEKFFDQLDMPEPPK